MKLCYKLVKILIICNLTKIKSEVCFETNTFFCFKERKYKYAEAIDGYNCIHFIIRIYC